MVSENEVKCLMYELGYVHTAAQNAREKPVADLLDNLDKLDATIKTLGVTLHGIFGDPWEELRKSG